MSDVIKKLTWKNKISQCEKIVNVEISSNNKLFD